MEDVKGTKIVSINGDGWCLLCCGEGYSGRCIYKADQCCDKFGAACSPGSKCCRSNYVKDDQNAVALETNVVWILLETHIVVALLSSVVGQSVAHIVCLVVGGNAAAMGMVVLVIYVVQ